MISFLSKGIAVYRKYGLLAFLGKLLRFSLLRLPFGYSSLSTLHEIIHGSGSECDLKKQSKSESSVSKFDTIHTSYDTKSSYFEPTSARKANVDAFSNLNAATQNPVLTCTDVTDYRRCEFVADPFLFVTMDGEWHMFFETYRSTQRPGGVISHAQSQNGLQWEYDKVVLEAEHHLSFPYVFQWRGNHYMVPEQGAANGRTVSLYQASDFPYNWSKQCDLISANHRTDDAVLFRWNERWWMLVGDQDTASTYLYHAESLTGEWTPHTENPVIHRRPLGFRPGGRPIVSGDDIILFMQDCETQYGDKLRAFEVTELSVSSFADRECRDSPILEGTGGTGWNSGRMHHIDPWYVDGRWWCAVDGGIGIGKSILGDGFSIGIYTSSN